MNKTIATIAAIVIATTAADAKVHDIDGKASYYWQPQRLASGGWFNPEAMTCAHKTLKFGSRVHVTNKHNGKSVTCVVNDRGPYIKGRVIDLSKGAARKIGMLNAGVVPVKLKVM
jgi:rare lipoprotein A